LDDMVRSDRTGGVLVHLTTSEDHSENSTKKCDDMENLFTSNFHIYYNRWRCIRW